MCFKFCDTYVNTQIASQSLAMTIVFAADYSYKHRLK